MPYLEIKRQVKFSFIMKLNTVGKNEDLYTQKPNMREYKIYKHDQVSNLGECVQLGEWG